MFKKTIVFPLVCAMLLSACSGSMNSSSGASSGDQSSYCETDQGKPACIIGGILFAGLVGGIIANHNHDSGGGGCVALHARGECK